MEPLVLIGGGGHCKSCIDVIESQGLYDIVGILDTNCEKEGSYCLAYPILGSDKDIEGLCKEYRNFAICVGQIKKWTPRKLYYDLVKLYGGEFPVLQSDSAIVSPYARVEEGTFIMHHAVVNAGARVGKCCIINTGAIIEHDAVIGDYCHISTGAIVNGSVHIGKGTFVGSQSVTREGIAVGHDCVIGAGLPIMGDVGDYTIVRE